MKNIGKDIKSGIVIAITFAITLGLIGTIYAAIDTKSQGDTLESEDWNNLITEVNNNSSEINTLPGMIVAFASDSCPTGWYPADGSVDSLDLRGVFIRGANSFDNGATYNNRDIDRANTGSGVLSYQDDQMRAIEGEVKRFNNLDHPLRENSEATGAFKKGSKGSVGFNMTSLNITAYGIGFDSGLLGNNYDGKDTHPKNIALIYCVKE